jgi:hypothetical protein
MIPEVQTSDGMVVVRTPDHSAIALNSAEAIDLARLLVAAAVDVAAPAPAHPKLVKTW